MASRAATKLSPPERAFVECHVFDGMTLYRAYMTAFVHRVGNWNCATPKHRQAMASMYASALMKRQHIQEYIQELKERLAEKALQQRFLSLEEKRAYLAKVVRTPIGEVDADHPIAQELKITPEGRSIKMPNKLQALEIDSRLMGEFQDSVRLDISEKVLNLVGDLT